METLQSIIFIEFDVNTKKITFLRKDNIIDYDSDATSIYVRVKYKDLSGNTVYLAPSELEDYKFYLYTIKPSTNNFNEIAGEVTDELKENVYGGVVKFEIPRVCTNRLGIVKCEIHINQENKMIASSTFTLNVKQSLVTEFDDALLGDEDLSILKQLILEVQKVNNIDDNNRSKTTTYSSDKVETIKEDLSSQIKEIKNNKTDKSTTNDIQQQINNLVLGAVGDGNNAEVVQARGNYSVLNERFEKNEERIKNVYTKLSNNITWESGTINNSGDLIDNSSRMRTAEYIKMNKGVICLNDYTNYKMLIIKYDLNKNFISYSDFQNMDYTIDSECYIKIILSKVSNETIESSEFETISSELSIYTLEYDGNFIKRNSISIDKVDFIEGYNLFNNKYSNLFISDSKVTTVNEAYIKAILLPLEKNKSIIISVEGKHNRFIINLGNSIDVGAPTTNIIRKTTTGTFLENSFEFTNSDNYKYMFITLAYSEPITPEIFDANVYIYDNKFLTINNEKIVKYKTNSIEGNLLKDKSIDINKLNFNINKYTDIYTTEVSNEEPYATTSIVYEKYDELRTNHSDYVSMNLLGTDDWGNEIREYIFKTPNYNSRTDNPRNQSGEIAKPKILLLTGIHGDERSPVLGVYKMLKDLCEMNSIDKMCNLRESVEIRIIPCAVPTGYNGNKRQNDNGVNINRNFSDGWVAISSNIDSSGASAASEKETQIIQSWLQTHNDSIYFMDIHNSGYSEEVTWISIKENTSYTDQLKNSYFKFVNSISKHWRKDFGLPSNRNIGYNGSFDFAGAQRYGDSLNIPSMTPEVSWLQNYTTDVSRFGPVTNAMTTEYIGNLLLKLCNDYI